mgnify:CR=1 FL=1
MTFSRHLTLPTISGFSAKTESVTSIYRIFFSCITLQLLFRSIRIPEVMRPARKQGGLQVTVAKAFIVT